MGVTALDDWLPAQNQLLAICLFEPDRIPAVLSELTADDFSGPYRLIFETMRKLFLAAKSASEVDAAAIYDALGHTPGNLDLLQKMMEFSPVVSAFPRYLELAKNGAKLSRLRDAGARINEAVTLESALLEAEDINKILSDGRKRKSYGPKDLTARFRQRHQEDIQRLPWPMDMAKDIPTRPGNMIAICAEPSGGKTAFGLQLMWEISKQQRVLFVSLETDEDTLFDCWTAFVSGIGMPSLMGGKLTAQEWKLFDQAEEAILGRDFEIVSGSGMTVAEIKALALAKRADVVIVDYLQLIQVPGAASRYETVTEISMQLHILAQTTGITVVPLCQVTNRDPNAANKALTMHSARESGQIEQDCDVMVMIDQYIEKELLEKGVRCNRVIRVVKNKRGQKHKFPARFDGLHQTFSRVAIPNQELEKARQEGARKQPRKELPQVEDLQQLPMETPVPFQDSAPHL